MAKHHRIPTLAENINRSPRLSYLSSHSQSASFMSESGEITELMTLDEAENLLHDRTTAAVQVISGSGGVLCGSYPGSFAPGAPLAGQLTPGGRLSMAAGLLAGSGVLLLRVTVNGGGLSPGIGSFGDGSERLEELGISFNEQLFGAVGGRISMAGSPAVTVVEMAGGRLTQRQKNFKRKSTATAAIVASGEQTSLNAIGLQLSVDRGGPQEWGEATRSYVKAQRRHAGRATFQGQVYNFLERPAGYNHVLGPKRTVIICLDATICLNIRQDSVSASTACFPRDSGETIHLANNTEIKILGPDPSRVNPGLFPKFVDTDSIRKKTDNQSSADERNARKGEELNLEAGVRDADDSQPAAVVASKAEDD
ncbi:hypothetical protein AND_002766 [Anopheles darlingi]|uniref:Uncharacterized protein n=1 Tax=Anopheles darlingi TaxID=43151 RepID=W5JRV8_ANODA|nr:hypothetical protein AND_002766 [Anopheles darlingi]